MNPERKSTTIPISLLAVTISNPHIETGLLEAMRTKEGEGPSKGTPVPYNLHHIKANRNEPCPCGSGLKFKKCCKGKDKP